MLLVEKFYKTQGVSDFCGNQLPRHTGAPCLPFIAPEEVACMIFHLEVIPPLIISSQSVPPFLLKYSLQN